MSMRVVIPIAGRDFDPPRSPFRGRSCARPGTASRLRRLTARAADDPDARIKLDGRRRDSLADARPAFVVRDGDCVSARWPGDVHTFATTFADVLAHAAANVAGAREPAR